SMQKSLVVVVACAVLGSAWLLWAHESRHDPRPIVPYPKATPPPPPSSVFTPSRDAAPSAEDIEREAREHVDVLAAGLWRCLESRDARARETAFTFVMPELVQTAPRRLVALLKDAPPGDARDTLRTELARQWITRDRDAAIEWMQSLDDRERRAAAVAAMHV